MNWFFRARADASEIIAEPRSAGMGKSQVMTPGNESIDVFFSSTAYFVTSSFSLQRFCAFCRPLLLYKKITCPWGYSRNHG